MTKLEIMQLSQSLSDLYTGLETDLIANIAEYLAEGNLDSPTAQWKIQMLARLGALDKANIKTIAEYAGIAPDMLTEALETAALNGISELEPGFRNLVRDGIVNGTEVPIEKTMAKAVTSYRRQAQKSLNLVNTVMLYKAKSTAQKIINDTAELAEKQSFIDMLNKAAGKTVTGIESRQAAMRQCIKEMSEKGIPAFVDKLGREWSPEAYINMDIRTTVANTAQQAQFDRMDDYGLDLIEVSSHAGARPKCAEDQGKIFNRKNKDGYTTDLHGRKVRYYSWERSSYGEPDGILGINCGHHIYPFIPGLSYQTYFPYDEYENQQEYKKIQNQRELERRVRKSKRECIALETAGDTEGLQKAQVTLKNRQKALKQYCADNGLRYKPDRTAVVNYRKSVAGFTPTDKKSKIAEIKAKAVDKSGGSGTVPNTQPPKLNSQPPKKPTKLERMKAELEESKKKTQQAKDELAQLYMDKKNLTYEEAKAKVDAIENKVRKGLDKPAQGGIIKEELANGNIKLEINHEKQARHIKGEPEYKEGKSYLTISEEEAQDIINAKSGTGTLLYDRKGNWKHKELIDCDKEIGIDVDVNTQKETPTDKATVHYSKTGTHLVPRKGENHD